MGIEGHFSVRDLARLSAIAAQVPENGAIVEIGSLYGRSTSAIFSAKKESVELFAVDIFVGDGIEIIPKIDHYKKLIKNMSAHGFFPYIIHGNSFQASHHFEDKTLDMVFIDGSHTEEAVYADIMNMLPKMKDGAVMCGHDFGAETVKRGLCRAFLGKSLGVSPGATIWEITI